MFSENDFEFQPTCNNCRHADLYLPYWVYPSSDPKCSVHHRTICPDDSCEDFELIGRLSR